MADHPRLRDRWIATVLRFHRLVLVLAVVITALAGWLASRLHVDSDLRSLLPSGDPVLVSLDRIETSFGTLGSVNIVVRGGTVDQRHAFADAVADKVADSELVRDVEYRLRSDFFADHALYYLADPEIRRRAWLGRLDHPAWTSDPNDGHAAIVRLDERRKLTRRDMALLRIPLCGQSGMEHDWQPQTLALLVDQHHFRRERVEVVISGIQLESTHT